MGGDSWNELAEGWDSDPYVVAYADAAIESLLAAVSIPADARVLDFGCGTGLLTERLAPRVDEVVAVDSAPAMVEALAAKSLPNVKPIAASWEPPSLPNNARALGPFDLIVCSSVCAFLKDYPGTVALLSILLGPAGHFVQWDWELDPKAEEPVGLTTASIKSALLNAGLNVVSLGYGFDVSVDGMQMRPLMGVGRRNPPSAL